MSTERPLTPLSIAGSDPSGGAGLQADLKVFLAHGLSAMAVPTALTVQAPSGVRRVHPLSGRHVKEQLVALLEDVRPAVVKLGLLPSAEVVRAVARALGPLTRKHIPIVIDPVLCASDGTRFLRKADVPVFVRQLVPLATVITPNLEEAAELTGRTVAEVEADVEGTLQLLIRRGAQAALLKGGHRSGDEAVDVLATKDEVTLLSVSRIPRRKNVHGTGCAFSAAIAAGLALGLDLDDAVGSAKVYVSRAIQTARRIGRGARQLDFLARPEDDEADDAS